MADEKLESESENISEQELTFFQRDGKPMAKLNNGKLVLLDKKENKQIDLGFPYLCKVKELEKVAFARVLGPSFSIPRIIPRDGAFMIVSKHGENSTKKTMKPNLHEAIKYLEDKNVEKFLYIIR